MQLPFFLALFCAAYAHADYVVTVLTSKTVTCTTQFGTTRVQPVPRDVTKTTIVTSTTLYVTTNTDTVYTTPEVTVSTTVTDYYTDYIIVETTTTETDTLTTVATGCPPPVKERAVKRDAAIAYTTGVNGVVYRLYPTSLMCTKTISILSQTTSFVGAITTVTADTTLTLTVTDAAIAITYATVTETVTETATATATSYPDCKPPANSTCSPAAQCYTFVEYECESGYDGFGTYSCDCGIDGTGVGACFQNEYCDPYVPCDIDDDCPYGQGCWTSNCCGYSICALYDVCGAQEPSYDVGVGFSVQSGTGLTAGGMGRKVR